MQKTRIFASAGNPIMHSASPQMHNAGFARLGIDAVYVRLAAASAEEALRIAKQIGMGGMSITSPFKEGMLALLDRKDARVQKLGAVNTVKLDGGEVSGFNTDIDGVSGALAAAGVAIRGRRAVVLGAGGAAKAAVCALVDAGAKVTVAARKKDKAGALAAQFGCGSCALEKEELARAMANAEIVVSALNTHERVVPPGLFRKGTAVLDATYSAKTALSSDAEAAGCKVIGGDAWLLWQGIAAFGIFTGKKAPVAEMKKAIAVKAARKENIALIGFMGSGKSETAKEIAKLSGMKLVDTDEKVERLAGKAASRIFEENGEAAFRKLEADALSDLAGAKGCVISCGGGAVLNPKNVEILKQNCNVIWLWASKEETGRRLAGARNRPLLDAKGRKARIKALLAERAPKYASCADLIIGTDGKTAKEVAAVIAREVGGMERCLESTNAHPGKTNGSAQARAGEQEVLLGKVDGSVLAPPSKSMAQRAVAAAALSAGTTRMLNFPECDDALASLECAKALGAKVEKQGNIIVIVGNGRPKGSATLDCHESGLCLRMFAPIAALSGKEITIAGKGSLLCRPVGMVQRPLEELGAECRTNHGMPPIVVKGPIHGGKLRVDGSASSQFITGLLMALPLCDQDSVLCVSNLKSKPYVEMTLALLKKFGVEIKHGKELGRFVIRGRQKYKPANYTVEGDWSAAAFLLVAGATAGKVGVRGLDAASLQADRAIIDALRLSGAKVSVENNEVVAEKSELKGFEFDATGCPDLFPPLVALACCCKGRSRIKGALRLRGKESDRAEALALEFGKMGGNVRVKGDAMEIEGCALAGGKVDSHNDHRIAMACAVAGLNSENGVRILGAGCVSKSYPEFFDDLLGLADGGSCMDPFSFGGKFRMRVFGSSHGKHVGVEIDGCPAGIKVGESDIQLWLDRRKPGASGLVSQRKEEDRVAVESGIEDGKTTGGRIRMLILNCDTRSKDYEKFGETPRPGHSDYPAMLKYGKVEPGGGFFSGRMTAAFVMAGAIAKKLLAEKGVETLAFSRQIGKVMDEEERDAKEIAKSTYSNPVRAAGPDAAEAMQKEIEAARDDGDSVGGVVECRVEGMPAGLGEPMFGSIESVISQAMFAIPAAKGIEFGSGFAGSRMRGSQNNDGFSAEGGKVVTKTNNSGGILGGLSTGMPIVFRVAFKPTSSIFKPQKTANVKKMKEEELRISGRHDPCIAIRAVPVVECVAAVCMAGIILGSEKIGWENGS